MHTLASDAATRRACDSRSSIPEERVIISARHCSRSAPGGLESFIASATVSSSTFGSNGLVRNENTPRRVAATASGMRSEEHTSELQSLRHLVCRLLLEKKKKKKTQEKTTHKYTTTNAEQYKRDQQMY